MRLQSLKDSIDKDNANPRDIKLKLAEELVARFYSKSIGKECTDNFINRFSNKQVTNDISAELVKKG